MKDKGQRNAHLLGIGLDNEDGHKRITQSKDFSIVGGSEETHQKMSETVIKTFEEMKQSGKSMKTVEPEELSDLLRKNTPA